MQITESEWKRCARKVLALEEAVRAELLTKLQEHDTIIAWWQREVITPWPEAPGAAALATTSPAVEPPAHSATDSPHATDQLA